MSSHLFALPLRAKSKTIHFLLPIQQARHASILGSLSDNAGAYNKRIRRGRGPASGKGKTSGRGHGGQKAHGKVPAGFIGGQTPDHVVAGPRGAKNLLASEISSVNLDKLQEWIDNGRLDITRPITIRELALSNCVHRVKDGVKLLARNAFLFKSPVHITVSHASKAAIEAVEKAGGKIQTRYYTRLAIQRIIKGEMHPILSLQSEEQIKYKALSLPPPQPTPAPSQVQPLNPAKEDGEIETQDATTTLQPSPASNLPISKLVHPAILAYQYRLPDASSRRDIEYYRDPAHRGYLAYTLRPNESPSLFFESPHDVEGKQLKLDARARRKAAKGNVGVTVSTVKMW